MNRRVFLLGMSAAALAPAMPAPLVIAAHPTRHVLDDRRLVLPDTHRFRYYTDSD